MIDAAPSVGASAIGAAPQFLPYDEFAQLPSELARLGYEVIGPTVRDGAILYDRIGSVDELPRGWTDVQEAGIYRLERRGDDRRFGYAVGPQSWKQFLFPPATTIAVAEADAAGWRVTAADGADAPRYAFLGMRACELAAVAVQDRVFMQADFVDPTYARRRERALFIAVHCAQAAPTCFCSSTQTGPRAAAGFDLALTELDDGFLVEIGSPCGAAVVAGLGIRPATDDQLRRGEAETQRAVDQQSRRLPVVELRGRLRDRPQHPHWQLIAERCLSCANCTMVCPTCFCSSVQEVTDLDAVRVERRRTWDSCFNIDFSYMNGGVVRNSIRSRYRQWLTHKLDAWHDQFGTSGCVGCGRCITWCPVGIDLTAEAAAICADPVDGGASS